MVLCTDKLCSSINTHLLIFFCPSLKFLKSGYFNREDDLSAPRVNFPTVTVMVKSCPVMLIGKAECLNCAGNHNAEKINALSSLSWEKQSLLF